MSISLFLFIIANDGSRVVIVIPVLSDPQVSQLAVICYLTQKIFFFSPRHDLTGGVKELEAKR